MLEKPAELFDRLEQSGLLSPSIVERRDALLGTESAEKAADELVRLKLLTEYQARVAVKDGSVPLSIGDYLVEDQIGRGGMGFVLKARHRRMKRQVAIKFLHKSMTESPDLVARFEREVEAAAQLHHQNIVTAYDAGEHDGSHFLVMQYVDGEDLSHRVKRDGPLRVSEAIDVIRQAAEGLGYAHEKGIVHRDIKPGNLLLDREGVVRILDMGLARMRPSPGDALDGGAHADLTNTGSVMGTVDYMAPEQALDAKTADFSADIYSLGCTLYFLLTGNPPFRSDTIMRRLLAHREQDIPLISHVRPEASSELDQVFGKMMAKKKEDRYPSMQHLVVALKSIELDDAEAEQMATIDAPDDGTGGFIKLPDPDQLDDSVEQSAFNDSSATTPTGSAVADPVASAAEATLIESDSQVSQTVVASDADSLSQSESFSEVPSIATSPTGASQQDSSRNTNGPPWKVIIPGIAAVLVVAILFAISRNGTDEVGTPESLADAEPQSAQSAVPEPESSGTQDSAGPVVTDSIEVSPDRRGAEWVLSIGGSVGIDTPDGTRLQVEDRDELPDCPFVLRNVSIPSIPELTDDGLMNLRGCSQLASLHAYDTAITDQGLANLTDEGRQPLRNLASLFIARTAVTEKGLEHLAESGKLKYLDIESNPVSDGSILGRFRELETINIALTEIPAEDLSALHALPRLWQLSVDGPQLQGAGGRHVSSLGNLRSLLVRYPGESFDGVVLRGLKELTTLHVLELPERRLDDLLWSAIAGLPRLNDLYLDGDGVTDASIGKMPALSQLRVLKLTNGENRLGGETIAAAVRGAPALKELVVSHNELNDGDARFLETLEQLTQLTLIDNDITAAAIEPLHKKLPNCRIESDHGTFQPTVSAMNPDRRAAEFALKLNGAVSVRVADRNLQQIMVLAELPTERFAVTEIDLAGNPSVDDESLPQFRGLADLQILILTDTSITDRGLANLTDEGRQPLPSLQRLYLDGTNVSQTGLQFLSGSHDLSGLMLDETAITEGAVLGQFPKLRMLGLGHASLTTEELQMIAGFPRLDRLTMDGRHLTETMAGILADLPELRALKLRDLPSDFDPDQLARLPLLTELYVNAEDSTVFDDDFWNVVSGLSELHILMCKGVTDQSLAKARPVPQIEVFIVMSRVVTGEALAKSMSKFPNVASLSVNFSDWTDNDVQQLYSLKSLGKLDLTKNSASVEAIKALSAALPGCRIISDHGTFEPTGSKRSNWALSFDGVDDFVDIPSLHHEPGTPITIEATISNWGEKYGMICGWRGCAELVLNRDQVGAGFGTSDLKKDETHKRSIEMPDTRTVRLALVCDASEGRLFANGKLLFRRKLTAPLKRSRDWYSSGFTIGAASFGDRGGFMAPVKATIDEVRVSRTARYDDDYAPEPLLKADAHTIALYHFDVGQGDVLRDSSGNGHDGKIHGATWEGIGAPETAHSEAQRNRRAAEWILKHDGNVIVRSLSTGGDKGAKAGEPLPDSPFHLVQINHNKLAPENEFANLTGLTELEGAFINYFPLTDAALANLKDSTKLRSLHLEGTQISTEGLDILQHFPSLEGLQLPAGQTDAVVPKLLTAKRLKRLGLGFKSERISSLSRLSELDQLESLRLLYVDVTADSSSPSSLQFLQRLPNLTSFGLGRCEVSTQCLRELAKLNRLRDLSFHDNFVEPDTLKELAQFQHLGSLTVSGAGLTDDSIGLFDNLTNLKSLNVLKNKLTPDGIATLRKSLPGCRIESDHGAFEPTAAAPNDQAR